MKKKVLALLLALSCTFSMAACAGNADTNETAVAKDAFAEDDKKEQASTTETETEPKTKEETTEAETETESEEETKEHSSQKPSVEMPSELSDDLYSFQISIDGTVYQFPMWYSDFEALGWEYDGDNSLTLSSNEYSVTEVWKKDGIRVYTNIANLSMNSAPLTNCIVTGISFDSYEMEDCDWEIILPGGIQYGVATIDDIKAAYGDPSSDYDGTYNYSMTYDYDIYQSIELAVSKETNVLSDIQIRNMVELEGADNSIDATVPDVVKDYKAPTSIGADLYSFDVEFEGNFYTLPAPVSVFLDNGFTINENGSNMEIGAGSTGWVELKHNNQTLRALVNNYADYATVVQNCFVTSIEANDYSAKFDLTIPGNITLGSSEDDVKKAVENVNCEVETTDYGNTYYDIENPDGSVLDGYTIVVEEGVVTRIEVENSTSPLE